MVVGVDGSDGSRAALAWAVTEARLRNDELAVVTVVDPPTMLFGGIGFDAEFQDEAERSARRRAQGLLDEMLARHRDAGVRVTPEMVGHSATAPALVERAAGSDGLVVGTRGHGGFAGMLLGSVSQQCAVHARSPVVVVPPPDRDDRRRDKVVVGIDGSEGARRALLRAAEEARLRGFELEVMTVLPPPPVTGVRSPADSAMSAYLWTGIAPPPTWERDADADRQHRQVVAHWQQQAEQRLDNELARVPPEQLPEKVTRTVIGQPHPARSLLDAAEWAQLLVVGSRGRGGFAGMLLGSVSQQCVRHATSPVLVVPPEAG
jgi:nucleotide-binding universal stress UspA family protein